MATILGKNISEAEADRITREAKEEAIKAIQPNSSQEKKREVMNNEAKQKRAEIKKAFESNKLNEKLMKEIVDKPTSKQEAVRKLLKTPPPKNVKGDNFIPKSVSKKAEEKESKKKAEEAVTEKKKGRPSGSLNKPPTEKLFESLSKVEQIRFLESEGVNIKDIPSSSKKGNLLKSDLMEFYKSNIIGRK
jgi:ATP-dependent exoDNAse (exonuclease V) beta subunit